VIRGIANSAAGPLLAQDPARAGHDLGGLLAEQPRPAHLEELARRFQRAARDDVQEVLNALVALGLARRLDGNRYAP